LQPTMVVGGLGGGGDVGLAAILAGYMLGNVKVVYASFASCRPHSYPGRRIAGSLTEPLGHHPRDFEWALKQLLPDAEVYRICLGSDEPGRAALEGLEWLHKSRSPCCSLHTDIGGDGLLTGFEAGLGSFKTDSLARAALAEASRRLGWRSLVAVGGLGLEGGKKRSLLLHELAADLLYYEWRGALLGVVEPPREASWIAWSLLALNTVSVMLPLYAAALEGRREFYVEKGYSTGLHRIEWWARYVFVLDAAASCSVSPLCQAALQGRGALREWRRRGKTLAVPGEYREALRTVKSDPEGVIRDIIERRLDDGLLKRVTSSG